MEHVLEMVKKHPVPIIGGAVILLLLIARAGSSGGGASSNAGAYLESQRISTAGNAQIAGINANAQIARGAQQVDAFKANLSYAGQLAVSRTALLEKVFSNSVAASTELQLSTDKNQTTRLLANLNHQDTQTQMANQLTLGQTAINAGVKMATDKLGADIQMNQDNNNARLNALGQSLSLDKYKTDVTSANLPMLLQHSENAARIAAANSEAITSINSTTAQIISANSTYAARKEADANARAKNAETSQSWISTAFDIGKMFFL